MKIELSHDVLAKRIYDIASAKQKAVRRAERLVHERFRLSEEQGGRWWLTDEELSHLMPHRDLMQLSKEEIDYLGKSERQMLRRKNSRIYKSVLVAGLMGLMFFGGTIYWGLDKKWQAENAQTSFIRTSDTLNEFRKVFNVHKPPKSLQWDNSKVAFRIEDEAGFPLRDVSVKVLGAEYFSDPEGRIQFHLIYPSLYRDTIAIELYRKGFSRKDTLIKPKNLVDLKVITLSRELRKPH